MLERALPLCLIILLIGVAGCTARGADPPLERLRLPPGFAIEVFAEVPGARSLAVADGGRKVYVGTRDEDLYAVLDSERDGVADGVLRVATGLNVPNGIAATDGRLFVAEQNRIVRFEPDGKIEVVVPDGVLPDFRHHGWRYARLGPDGKLYVAIGAPCNICDVAGFEGTIVRMNPDGHRLEIFARGVRNSVGFDWHPVTGEIFFTDNGGDGLGDTIPPDELNRAPEQDLHFGYPYVYGDGVPYPQFAGRRPPIEMTSPALAFEAHVAALGIHFYRGSMFPDEFRNDAFVAQHGSWNRSEPIGYRVVRVRFDDQGSPLGKQVFIDGWLGRDGRAWGRVVDIAELPDGSLLVSDDHAGLIYRITYGGG
ncbi:MAG TPA: PQQ-dependent sugar dehydrogenase [Geminicoccaceae bacterium]|nr:PQQ-dependent sugar dehydrogenase [Geminicoccaceae bacterium]